MIGISVYLKDLDLNYIKQASHYGAKYVFTSLQIPEEDYSEAEKKISLLVQTCRESHLILVPDISPITLKTLHISPADLTKLSEMGFTHLRLDYGFDDFTLISKLLNQFSLMLNASVIDEDYLRLAKAAGVHMSKIYLTHNFYPHTGTGLDLEYFKEKNKLFKSYGCQIQAFVCGDDLKRFPLYEGLCTVEKHRTMHPLCATVELLQKCLVDDVFIGDSKAKISTLRAMQSYMKDHTLLLPCYLEPPYISFYNKKLKVRKEISENVIRMIWPRNKDVNIYHNTERYRGTIVMDNRLSGRYSGELTISKKNLPFESRSNVIGYIHPEYLSILNFIDSKTEIIFEPMEGCKC